MTRSLAFVMLPAIWLAGSAGAQDRTEALKKAKLKFEREIAKSEDALLAGIDKTMAQATKAGNKTLQEKLAYERDLFVSNRIVPTAYLPDTYLMQRKTATKALQEVFNSAIAEMNKAKKYTEAAEIEDSLSEILKASRGYGLAFPDLEAQPMLHIVNSASGLVVDTSNDRGSGELVLNKKVGKSKPSQCWKIEREEKGFVLRNVQSGQGIDVTSATNEPGTNVGTRNIDRKKETKPESLFKPIEVRHEIVLENLASSLVLTTSEQKVKGVTMTYLTLDKRASPTPATQLWTVIEAK